MAQTTDETKHVEIDPARRMAVLENGVYTQSHNMLHVVFLSRMYWRWGLLDS